MTRDIELSSMQNAGCGNESKWESGILLRWRYSCLAERLVHGGPCIPIPVHCSPLSPLSTAPAR